MAKVQLLQRLRLVPAPAPDSLPRPSPKPISSVQDADTRILSFPRGPAPGSRLSPEFVREIGRFAYLWGWPLVNVFNRYTSFKRLWRPLLIGGIAPVAPINHLAMLHDYIGSKQRYITCPSQDLVYGFGIFDLGREPVVVQVPDFGKRYWVYQATDLRTDGFAEIGAMYGTKPGFYLLVGPDWNDHKPENITAVFRSSTNIGTIVPRVFQEDGKADNAALQPLIREILADPLSEFDGTVKTKDWSDLPRFPWIKLGDEEWKWVDPATFFDGGTDFYTRTAIAKSNIFINRPRETRYFYQDLDNRGERLTGASRYTVTFDALPPVDAKGFWSITLYNQHHFFAPNELDRFSLGTKSKGLRFEADGSLVIHVQKDRPDDDKVANWLPAPADAFSLYIRAYWPLDALNEGGWTPPPVVAG